MRILNSELFSKSHRLSAFLRFIFDQYSHGHAGSIHEQRIGHEVFGRPPAYHVGEDSIVRSQARFLRQRLEEYFATEGSQEPFVLLIPKGSYVPAFERREVKPVPPPARPVAVPTQQPAQSAKSWAATPLYWIAGGAVALSAVLILLLGLLIHAQQQRSGIAEEPVVQAFWSSIFSPGRTAILVPADSTLVLMEEISGKPVHLLSYLNKDYLNGNNAERSPVWNMLIGSQYTNMADLNLVARLQQIPEAATARPQIRFARELTIKELKDSNAVLIGGLRANPWLELFSSAVNFDVDFDGASGHNVVRNRAPGANEQTLYVEDTSGAPTDSRAYGVVVYLPSLDNQGHSLLVEGTSKAGTEAAAEFLNSPAFAGFLQKIGATATTVPNFELLLSTGSMNGASYHPAVVCWHRLHTSAVK
jgi:hypothetical protein